MSGKPSVARDARHLAVALEGVFEILNQHRARAGIVADATEQERTDARHACPRCRHLDHRRVADAPDADVADADPLPGDFTRQERGRAPAQIVERHFDLERKMNSGLGAGQRERGQRPRIDDGPCAHRHDARTRREHQRAS